MLLLVKEAVRVTFCCSVGEVTVVKVGVAPDEVGVVPVRDNVEPVSDWLRLS